MHSTNDAVVGMAREAIKYMDGAKSVATELGSLDSSQKVELGAKMLKSALAPDVDTYAGAIPATTVPAVEDVLTAHGFPVVMSHHLKLWMLVISLSLPSCETKGQQMGLPEVDELIARAGKDKGLPVVGLESIDEQLAVIASTPNALAATLLIASARLESLNEDAYVTLLDRYLEKRASSALAILDAAPGQTNEERDASNAMTRQLLAGRNEIMLARSKPLLAKGGAFIAVGALHLVGKGGLVELARRAGYRVTKVW